MSSAVELVSSAERRQGLGVSPRGSAVAVARFVCTHWLFLANASLIVFATLPIVAPLLVFLGAHDVALRIFQSYSFTCHQLPSRSYFIVGNQMAYCERNTAIYSTMAIAGLAYVGLRARGLQPLSIAVYLILILPMAVDGFTQLFELRESTWYLRGITGILFGVATVWLAFPRLNVNFLEIESDLNEARSTTEST